MSFAQTLAQPLTLPCGTSLPNRSGKSAMSETLGTLDNRPTQERARPYGRWAAGGSGLVITGNVMTGRRYLGAPHNVTVEAERDLALLTRWANAGTRPGNPLWAQLNHPAKPT